MGFSLGGIFKSLVNPMSLMQLAMGPAGWASLAMKTIGMAIAQQVIQQLGQQLGLPQGIINMAQSAFASAAGQPGAGVTSIRDAVSAAVEQGNLSPRQAGELTRAAEFDVKSMLEILTQASVDGKKKGEKTGGKGGSWLRVIAEALAAQMDKKIEEMQGLSKKMDGVKHLKDGKTESTQIQTDLQVATQEFSMLMQSSANIIKTMGEGLSNMARKG